MTRLRTALVSAIAALLVAAPAAHAAADPVDLAVTAADTPDPVDLGGRITYTIAVSNRGPGTAPGANLSVATPEGTTFTSFTVPPSWTSSAPPAGGSGTVTATLDGLVPRGPAIFKLVVTTDSDTVAETVNLSVSMSSAADDPMPENNTATAATAVRTAADLALTVTDRPDRVNAGADLTYTVMLANAGPGTARDAVLTIVTPTGTAFTSLAGPAGWTSNLPPVGGAGTITARLDSLPVGRPTTFTLKVTVLANTAHGTTLDLVPRIASATSDPRRGNNSETETTTVTNAADLAVTVSDDRDPVDAAGSATYTLTLTNDGPTPAANPTLSIGALAGTGFSSFTAPAGWTSSTPAVGAADGVSATAEVLAPAETATFTLVLSIGSASELSLTATVHAGTPDSAAGNNAATETTTVTSPPPGTPPPKAATGRGGPSLTASSVVRLAGVTVVLVGLGLLLLALTRSRRTRRGYRYSR